MKYTSPSAVPFGWHVVRRAANPSTLVAIAGALALSAALAPATAQAAQMGADFASDYTVTNLGGISSVPSRFGGLTFLDSNTLLIGGDAARAGGAIYSVPVIRGADGHISSFGTASFVATAPWIDGGLVVAPNGTILFSQYRDSSIDKIGQIPLGATAPTKYVTSPVNTKSEYRTGGTLQIIPSGFAGAGNLLISSYYYGTFTTAPLVADGQGTFNLGAHSPLTGTKYYAEGAVYLPGGNPGFAENSMVVSDYYAGAVYSFALNADGTPMASTAKTFVSDVEGVEGAALDPVTGDFFFSTYAANSEIFSVRGFTVLSAVPEPQTYAMLLAGLALVAGVVRRKRLA